MGYLFLSVSLFAGAAKGFCGKKTSGYTSDFRDAVLVNVIRMFLCIIAGFLFVLFQGGIGTLVAHTDMILFALLAGVSTAVFAVTWLLSVKVGAYMLVDISLMCGVFVPVIGSLLIFKEAVSPRDFISMGLLIAAVVCMCLYNNRTKAKLTLTAVIILLLCGIASGFSDFSQKLYVSDGGEAIAAFSFYTYVFATLTLLVFYGISLLAQRNIPHKTHIPMKRVLPFIVVMALCMFAASFFQTLAAKSIPAAELYPLARGIALILSAGMSWLFFREKPTVGSVLGMTLALAALILINL